MRQFVEFIPIALFVGIYFTTKDIYLATALLMAGVVVQLGYERWREKEISKRTQMIFWVVLLAGSATLIFRDELFIKWKPTIINWLFCVALVASQYLTRENLLQRMLGGQVHLPAQVWRTLCFGWSFGFFFAGALNLVVAYSFSTDFWVVYKLVGGFALTLSYLAVTGIYLVKGGYLKDRLPRGASEEEKAANVVRHHR